MCPIPIKCLTVSSFLRLYSLRCGCIFIFIWTLLRSLFFLAFFVLTALLMFMTESKKKEGRPSGICFFFVFVAYVAMIVTESFVFISCILLGKGLYFDNSSLVAGYLRCRFFTLVVEILALVCLILCHHYFFKWYLGFLIIIILEVYFFIVVYSYYVDMMLQEREWENRLKCQPYKPCPEICVHYSSLTGRREPSVSGKSQDTRDIEASQTTPDATDTPNTRTKRDMSTRSDTQKPKDKQ